MRGMPSAEQLRSTPMAVRAALLVVAVLAATWLALAHRNLRLEHDAFQQIGATPPNTAGALALLQDARLLNASTERIQVKAIAYWNAGQRDRAIAQLREVVAQEPENATAWGLLTYYLRQTDPRAAEVAAARARALGGRPPR